MKKRNGFTVSEVVITLFLIGVIAMMTIPSVVSDYRKKIYSTSLATAVAGLNSAMTTMIEKERANNLFETNAWRRISSNGTTYQLANTNGDNFVSEISKNIIVTRQNVFGEPYRRFDDENHTLNLNELDNFVIVRSKKGFDYIFEINIDTSSEEHIVKEEIEALREGFNYTENAGTVYIDVNGVNNGPNLTGRDFFVFDLGADGRLYPYGGTDYTFYHDSNGGCSVDRRRNCENDARCCSAYMVEQGYNMDY